MPNINTIWDRICSHEGEEFRQKMGQIFTYKIHGNVLVPSTTDQNLPKSQFEKALERMPLEGPGQINDLRGPSYLYAILTDDRIK